MPSLLDIFTVMENSGVGRAIRDSLWLFPVVETFHLLGLGVIGCAVLIVNLRMLGLGVNGTPLSELARDTKPILRGSLLVMLISGLLLFISEATKCYYSNAFRAKMISLALAIIFTFTVQNRIVNAEDHKAEPGVLKVVAIISLILWTGVGVGGRWIGFS